MALPLAEDPVRPFTFADLDAAPNDGRRWELIAGSLVVSPAPFGVHQLCVMELAATLRAARMSETLVLPAPYDWRVHETGENFQPDVMVIRRADFDPEGPLRATPLLVVEVVSPHGADQDYTVKRARYEALKVPGYWIIDPAGPSLTELRLSGRGRYVDWTVATGEELFTTDVPFPVEFSPGTLTTPTP